MGCDLLQSLSFGFRDTGQSEKDTEDAEGSGQPEGTVRPEHLLLREWRGRAWTRQVRSPHAPAEKPRPQSGPTPPRLTGVEEVPGSAIQKPELSTVQGVEVVWRGH